MGRKRNTDYSPVLERCMRVADVSDLVSLAERLDVSPFTVRNWHQRGRVPYDWLERIATKFASTMDYLLHGVRVRNGVYYDEDGAEVPPPSVTTDTAEAIDSVMRESRGPYVVPARALDDEYLELVLTAVLTAAERRAEPLDARRLAKLIALVYERTAELTGRGGSSAEEVADREAEKLVDLLTG